MFGHTWYVKYLGLLIWNFTFPYLKELDNPPMWTFQRPFLFTSHLLNCWTKVIPTLIPGNLTVYLFQKKMYFISPFYFLFRRPFPMCDKTFSPVPRVTHFLGGYGVWCKTLFTCFESKNRFLAYPSSTAMNTYPFKRIHDAVSYSFPLFKWHYFPHHRWNVQSPLLVLIFTNLTTFIIWEKRKRNSYVPNVPRQILYNK